MTSITNSINISFYNCPFGYFKIGCTESAVVSIEIVKTCGNENRTTALSDEVFKQLNEYLDGKRKTFDLPLKISGTPFQQKVYKALCEIPYGETRSYKEIAAEIGKPKACRAVGMANNKNPIVIAVPCHRVIGANGSLVGYGCGLDMKKYLLELEAKNK